MITHEEKKTTKNLLTGGKGDRLSPKNVNRKELAMGIKTEMEHTSSKRIAKEIALDHLAEDKKYYTKLKKIHKEKPKKRKSKKPVKKTRKKETKKKNPIKSTNTVRVYRNLNTGTLSAQEKTAKGWRVTMHPDQIKLKNAKFKVNQAGRKKVLKTKQKNVHAMIEGELVDTKSKVSGKKIVYNPYKTSQFMLQSGKKVFESEVVSVDSKGDIRAKGIS